MTSTHILSLRICGVKQHRPQTLRTPQHRKHEHASKKVTELRNKARKQFRQEHEGRNVFDSHRQHNKVKGRSQKCRGYDSVMKGKQRCHLEIFTRPSE